MEAALKGFSPLFCYFDQDSGLEPADSFINGVFYISKCYWISHSLLLTASQPCLIFLLKSHIRVLLSGLEGHMRVLLVLTHHLIQSLWCDFYTYKEISFCFQISYIFSPGFKRHCIFNYFSKYRFLQRFIRLPCTFSVHSFDFHSGPWAPHTSK